MFESIIENANTNPNIKIKLLVDPDADRSQLTPENMPIELLNPDELKILIDTENRQIVEKQITSGYTIEDLINLLSKKNLNKQKLKKIIPFLDSDARMILPLRDTDNAYVMKKTYNRR